MFWHILLAMQYIYWLQFPLILGYLKSNLSTTVTYILHFLHFFFMKICWEMNKFFKNWPFLRHTWLRILTLNLHKAQHWNCTMSFKTPTSSHQHINLNVLSSHHHHLLSSLSFPSLFPSSLPPHPPSLPPPHSHLLLPLSTLGNAHFGPT